MTESHERRAAAVPDSPKDMWPALVLGAATALATGLLLWQFWWWAGYPPGVFRPGLDGHGPDPHAWPRLLAPWVPMAHVLFGLAYAVLARWDPRRSLRPYCLADQVSLALVLPLLAGLLLVGPEGHWRALLGTWYTVFIGAKTAIFVRGLWRWLGSQPLRVGQASVGVFLASFLPYLFLGGHVTTAMSTSSDEPYYLLVAHSLLHDHDADLANNFAGRDYLPFYWGDLPRDPRAIRTTADGRMYARLYQGFQPVLLLPGYAAAGRPGAVVTTNVLGAATLVLMFRLMLASGASLHAAFLAWLGVAFSVPFLTYSASPFPEMTGAFFATTAAYLLRNAATIRGARVAAALCLVAMVAAKARLFLLVPPLALAFPRRLNWASLGVTAGALLAAIAVAVAYDALVLSGYVLWLATGGGTLAALHRFVNWTIRAPAEYRGHLGLLLDQEFGLLAAAPVFALALAGTAAIAVERRWRLLLLVAGPFLVVWYYLGSAALGNITMRGLSQWYGGYSPPARFLMATLPLLAIPAALALDRMRGWLGWSVTAALYTGTLALAAVVSIWPAWRFQDAVGRARPLLAAFRRTGLDLGRFLPSFIAPDGGWTWVGAGALAAILVAGYALSRRTGRDAPPRAWLAGIVAAPLAVVALIVLAWIHPSGPYPAVLGVGRGGATFWGPLAVSTANGTATVERLVWATQRSGALELAPRLRPGRHVIIVRAGAQATGPGPALTVQAGTDPAHVVHLETAAPPVWRERAYEVDVQWAGGRLPIRLELGQVSRQDPVRLAYIESIEIRRRVP